MKAKYYSLITINSHVCHKKIISSFAHMYLCRLIGDCFCLRVDHGRLFGTRLDSIKSLMDKNEKWVQIGEREQRENSSTNNICANVKLAAMSEQIAVGIDCSLCVFVLKILPNGSNLINGACL